MKNKHKIETITFLSVMLLASHLFSDPGDVITEITTSTDPNYTEGREVPHAVIDGDLYIEDSDDSNDLDPGLLVEGGFSVGGLTELHGGLQLKKIDTQDPQAPQIELDVAGDAAISGDLDVEGALSLGSSIVEITDPENTQSVDLSLLTTKAYVDTEIEQSSVIDSGGRASWGFSNTVSGILYPTAWGFGNTANAPISTAWGFSNNANGLISTAWGDNNAASGYASTAWGRGNNAESLCATVFGRFNVGGFSYSDDGNNYNDGDNVWFEIDPLLEIGIGIGNSTNERANALTLLKNGRIAFGKHTSLDALQAQPETVQVQGALKVGDYSSDPGDGASEGAIRFGDDGSGNNDFLGYVGGTWKSLTQSNHVDGDLQVDGDIVLADHAGDIPSITY